ncbi:MAG: OB-fold nucleic acid binding domain-containing protein [Promethearchaeota archaeon]
MKEKEYKNLESLIIYKTGLSLSEIREKVKEKQEELKGLISAKASLLLLAREFGISHSNSKKITEISSLTLGMKDITVVGRIRFLHRLNSFKRDLWMGKIGTFTIFDKTGCVKVVLWNEQTEIMRNLRPNLLIKINGCNVKSRKNEEMSLQLEHDGDIQINLSVMKEKDYPIYQQKEFQVWHIESGEETEYHNDLVTVSVCIMDIKDIKVFERKDGLKGQMRIVIIADSTGIIKVTFWNKKVGLTESFTLGDIVTITNLKRKKWKKQATLESTMGTEIKKYDYDIVDLPNIEAIKKYRYSNWLTHIEGIVVKRGDMGECDIYGKELFQQIDIRDDTGVMTVTIFDEDINKFNDVFREGNKVKLLNVLVNRFDNKFKCVDFETTQITDIGILGTFTSDEEIEAELKRMKAEKRNL